MVLSEDTLPLIRSPSGMKAVEYLKNLLTLMTCVVLFYFALWGIFESTLYPGGKNYQLTSLTVTLTLGYLAGELATVVKLPNIVGMTIAGILLRNLPGQFAIAASIDSKVMSVLRNLALAVIMLKAGIGMDLQVLRRLKSACLRLAILPGLAEVIATATIGYFLLNLPVFWGLAAGFVLKAVSPAVVVPTCVSLQRRQIGTAKGIPTLILASASFDDVIAIAGFGVFLSTIFTTESSSLAWSILRGPVAVVLGLIYGLLIGFFCQFLQNKKGTNLLRGSLLLLASFGVIFGSEALRFDSAGAIGCIVLGATAVKPWKNDAAKHRNLEDAFASIWLFLENVLFVLIGASVDLQLIDTSVLFKSAITLIFTHIIRMAATVLFMSGAGFNNKEKLFIAVAWLPKATVQAALGSVALDAAQRDGTEEYIVLGRTVLTLAVLSILMTAPLGAAATELLASRLLTNDAGQSERPVENSRTSEHSAVSVFEEKM